MKHFKLISMALLVVAAICFMGCNPSTGKNGTGKDENGGGENQTSAYVGIKAPTEAKAVGDIVFSDGSATPYTEGLTFNDGQKAKVIAVIYKVDDGKVYGIGIVHGSKHLWCKDPSAKGYEVGFSDIQCIPSGNAGELTFSGDTDGSDNYEQMGKALGLEDDTDDLDNYPAFKYAINYKDVSGSHVKGTAFENGWYLPTIAEMFDVWKEKTLIEAAGGLYNGTAFKGSWYWTSSQDVGDKKNALVLKISDGSARGSLKINNLQNSCDVCVIRVFD